MSIKHFHLDSDFLRERRFLTVHTPPQCDSASQWSVVYCADGQMVEAFSKHLGTDLGTRLWPQVIPIGAHSTQNRQAEYTLGHDESRFLSHEQFFTQELPPLGSDHAWGTRGAKSNCCLWFLSWRSICPDHGVETR